MTDEPGSILAQVDDQLRREQPLAAWRLLGRLIDHRRDLPAALGQEVLERLAQIGEAFGIEALVARARAAKADLDHVPALLDLGWVLIEQGLPAAAATVLRRAWRLAPGDPAVLQELVTALSELGAHGSALEVLTEVPELSEIPVIGWLAAHHALYAGQISVARTYADRLIAWRDAGDLVFETTATLEALARSEVIRSRSLDDRDLRGWHFVTSGGLLLHVAEAGRDEGMNGRYAFVRDTPELVVECLAAAELVLRAAPRLPLAVLAFPDPRSLALAEALGARLDRPVRPVDLADPARPGVIVVDDLQTASAAQLDWLREKRPGQTLWQHATCWTRQGPIAPDLCSFVYQFREAGWKADAGRLGQTPLPEGAGDDKHELLALAQVEAEDEARPTCRRSRAVRPRWQGTSPVRSSRFV